MRKQRATTARQLPATTAPTSMAPLKPPWRTRNSVTPREAWTRFNRVASCSDTPKSDAIRSPSYRASGPTTSRNDLDRKWTACSGSCGADGLIGRSRSVRPGRATRHHETAAGWPRPRPEGPPRRRRGSSKHPRRVGQAHERPDQHQHTHRGEHRRRRRSVRPRWRRPAGPMPMESPATAMPSGTSRTKRRANRTPACRLTRVLAALESSTRSSISPASWRRSRSDPPTSWATTNVSHTVSTVGSASRSFKSAVVRSKSVVSSHSRSAAANAGRHSSGACRPTSNKA